MKIVIALATYNRPFLTSLCLENLSAMRSEDVRLVVYDDASTAYTKSELQEYADEVVRFDRNGGIERSRAKSFRDFTYRFTDYDLLYLTDNDTLHDVTFLDVISDLYDAQKNKTTQMPVSVYNTKWHSYEANVLKEMDSLMVVRTMPGVSQCYNRDMVKKITDYLNTDPEIESTYGWDYRWPAVLGTPCLLTKTSYLEHFARDRMEGGMHCDINANGDDVMADFERDRALFPTATLQSIRQLVIEQIMNQ